jgi:hypothetical protein
MALHGRDAMKYTLQFVPQDMGLYDMLNQFQTGKSMSATSLCCA